MKREALTDTLLFKAVADSIVKYTGTVNSAIVGKIREAYEVNSVKASSFVGRHLDLKALEEGITKTTQKVIKKFLKAVPDFD
jgi:hypothetical protein